MRTALPFVAALALAACQPAGTTEEVPPPADAPAAPDAAPDASAEQPAAEVALALDGEGLRLVDPESGSTRLIPFGGAQADTLAALTNALGAPTETGTNADCPPGPVDFADFGQAMTLYFQDGAFAGWFTRDSGQSTMNGIAPGSTRADLAGSGSAVEFTETSLGQEFDVGGVYGIMNEDASAVDLLWAGANCFAR